MNDVPREKLQYIIQTLGIDITEPRRCEGALRDLCPEYKREIWILTAALKTDIPRDLQQLSSIEPHEILIPRLVKRLEDDCGIRESLARWAVETWAFALGVIKSKFKLTIDADPADASIRLIHVKRKYQPGMELEPGRYELEAARNGYETLKQSFEITDHDVTVTVSLKEIRYVLTIHPDPADADIRITNNRHTYHPGIRLKPGMYHIEVTRKGFAPKNQWIEITDQDLSVDIVLEKTRYALTVNAEPSDADIRVLNIQSVYQPGIRLETGRYDIEVSRKGFDTKTETVEIKDRDVTLKVRLTETRWALTVVTDPADADIKIAAGHIKYQPGILLKPGHYRVRISRKGYREKILPVNIKDQDVTETVRLDGKKGRLAPAIALLMAIALLIVLYGELNRGPELFHLIITPEPADAVVNLVDGDKENVRVVLLPPGDYQFEVSRSGYHSHKESVKIVDRDVQKKITLKQIKYGLTILPEPSDAVVEFVDTDMKYTPGIKLPPDRYKLQANARGYQQKQVQVSVIDRDLSIPVKLQPLNQSLTVKTEPADAAVKILGMGQDTVYRPGMALAPGDYRIAVSHEHYDSKILPVEIKNAPVSLIVKLERNQWQLTVIPEPSDAVVKIMNITPRYQPGIFLSPGKYDIKVSKNGYKTHEQSIQIEDSDVSLKVNLEKQIIDDPIDGQAKPDRLRNYPITVSSGNAKQTFELNDRWRPLKYVNNKFKDNGDDTITDHATGLTWQKYGSDDWLTFDEAQNYIKNELNQGKGFAGHKDWRLPTMEELMSLLEPEKSSNGLYINRVFGNKQWYCWSSDRMSSSVGWGVDFNGGYVSTDCILYCRAVRP